MLEASDESVVDGEKNNVWVVEIKRQARMDTGIEGGESSFMITRGGGPCQHGFMCIYVWM